MTFLLNNRIFNPADPLYPDDDYFMTGPAGPLGPTGSLGPTGPQGIAGPSGGVTGPQGEIGPTGAQGIQGPTGPTGAQGIFGVTGPTGPQGEIGSTGAQGILGSTGPTGPQGEIGSTGAQGILGSTGPTGPQGITGATGQAGVGGSTGYVGEFYSLTNQFGVTDHVAKVITFDNTTISNQITLVNNSQIVIGFPGTYNVQFSAQFTNSASASIPSAIWFSQNGTAIPNSNTQVDVGHGHDVLALNLFIETKSNNEYVELYWATDDVSKVSLQTVVPTVGPVSPAIIITVHQLTYVQVGPTGPQGTAGATGVGATGPTGPAGGGGDVRIFSFQNNGPATVNIAAVDNQYISWSPVASLISQNNIGTIYTVWSAGSPTTITLPKTAWYRVVFSSWAGFLTPGYFILHPRVNGTEISTLLANQDTVGRTTYSFSLEFPANAGDPLVFYCEIASGSANFHVGMMTVTYLSY